MIYTGRWEGGGAALRPVFAEPAQLESCTGSACVLPAESGMGAVWEGNTPESWERNMERCIAKMALELLW